MKKICFYHGNCSDGFASAWAMKQAYPDQDISFVPIIHSDTIPEIEKNDIIIFLDFAPQRTELIELSKKASKITILDHHITAQNDLKNVEKELRCPSFIKFDMERSGCQMAWDHFVSTTARPKVLEHIADRDLRKFEMKETRDITAAVYEKPHDFKIWSEMMKYENYSQIIKEGKEINKKNKLEIHRLYRTQTSPKIIFGEKVFVGMAELKKSSDLADYMLEMDIENEFKYSIVYTPVKNGKYKLTIRSTDDRVSVEEIALKFGGGGHRNMAGATVDVLPWNPVNNIKTNIPSIMESEEECNPIKFVKQE